MTVQGMPQPGALPYVRPCPSCGREWGAGVACQFCNQVEGLPEGVRIASAGRRFGGWLLEGLFLLITLIIGWFIWSLFTWRNGQTPAKKALGMRCVKLQTDQTASWGTMCIREVIAKPVIGLLSWVTFGIVNFWLVWDKNTQELWDKMVGTIVVDDPQHAMATDALHKQPSPWHADKNPSASKAH